MDAQKLSPSVAVRLSLMMFLQFFVWGAWYVTAPLYLRPLGFTDIHISWVYSVGPIAGIISPFFVGMIADRFFATERVLGVMHLLGAGAMYGAMVLMGQERPDPVLIIVLFFVHMLCYFPTLALVNTLALHNLSSSEKQFPLIRVFGTIGWIAAGFIISMLKWDARIEFFRLAVLSQAFLGVLSFALPHTPPPARGQPFSAREALGVDALVLLKQPSYLVFMVSSFLVCIPLAFYYQLAQNGLDAGGVVDIAQTMAYGQVSEIFFMVVMPFFLVRLGVKWMLAIGMLAWTARYVLFAFGVPGGVFWMFYGGVILHGICYDFFFVTGQLYTDRVAPAKIRGQAQGMLVLFTLGLGMLIGAQVAGQVEKHFSPPAEEKKAFTDGASALATEIAALVKTRQESQVAVPGIDERIDQLRAERRGLLLQTVDWKALWLVPAIGAAVVLVLFSLTFKDRIRRDDLVSKSIDKKPDEDGGEA